MSFAALAVGALAVPPAMAQQSALEEIVITAQFRQQNLQDTPLAITAMNSELMEARGYLRVSDITAQAPNVLLQPNPSGQGNSMRAFIRGVGQADQSPSVEPGVGIYVDDIYFATVTGSIFELLDLDRVEVLRGPQGTLSGMNSLGGSVKLYSREPSSEGGYVEATVGNFNRRDFRASADTAIVPDQLFFRVAGLYRERDGYVKLLDYACSHPDDPYVVSGALRPQTSNDNCRVGSLGDQSVAALRGSLLYAPGNGIEVNIIGDWTRDNATTQPTVLLQAGEPVPGASLNYQGVPYDNRFVTHGEYAGDSVISDPYVNYANYFDPGVTYEAIDVAGNPGRPNGPLQLTPANTLDAWGLSGKVTADLSTSLTLESITGYRKYSTVGTSDNDASPVMMLLNETNFDHNQFSQEVRLSGVFFDDRVHAVVGGIYFNQETVYFERVNAPLVAGIYGPPDMPTYHFLQQDEAEMTNLSGFGHVTWDMTDRLSLAGGIRVTNQKKDYTFYRFGLDGQSPFPILSDPANPLNGRTGQYKETMVDYRANVSYRWTDELMTYAQFATGFKGGGIAPRPYWPQQIRGFGPEKLQSYELGVKSDFWDRRARVNAAVFHMDYTDYQATPQVCVDEDGEPLPLPYGTPGLCGQYLNVADARVRGFEVELFVEPVAGLTIDGSLSYLNFEFKEPKIATNEVVEGASRPGVGDWQWSAGAQYELPFLQGTLTPRFDVSYISGYCGNLACTPIAQNDGFTLANARLTYLSPDESWRLSLEVLNLFDKFYYINRFVSAYAIGQPGRPREWAVTLRRSF